MTALLGSAAAMLFGVEGEARGRHHKGKKGRRQRSSGRQQEAVLTNPPQDCPSGQSVCNAASAPAASDCDVCPSGCPFSSLQPAIDAAAAGATIRVCAGEYQSNRSLFIAKNLTIVGAGAEKTLLQGGGFVRVLDISQRFIVTLRDLSLSGGFEQRTLQDGGGGGGILVRPGGALTLERVRVEDNIGKDGGGIALGTGSALTMIDSAVSDNSTISVGGGIWIGEGAVATLQDGSRVSDNSAKLWGGGIALQAGRVALEAGSSVSENTAGIRGGGIYAGRLDTVTLAAGSHVTANSAQDGGGVWHDRATVTIADTAIVRDNDPNNCGGTPTANCAG
jgi:hypothetical protein